jgi:aminoglycoside phosphotransferase (APT) family kinase protein
MTLADRQAAFSGTREVSPALAMDRTRLADYLQTRIADFAGPLSIRQFRGGQSNPTYLLETPQARYVLRRKPPGHLLPSAHAVDREFRIISALYRQGFPVPQPYLYCDDERIAGTAFYVMSFADGRVFWEPHMPGETASERSAIYRAMNVTLAKLHSFDPAAIGLSDFGRGEGYVARQIARWSQQYRASETETIDDMDALIAWLPHHVPPQQAIRIVHGDYRLDNMVVAHGEPDIIAVLDWELSTLGDPLADFTYHLMQWHMPHSDSHAGTGSLAGLDLAALGLPSMQDYVAQYVAQTALDPRPHLPVYLAYNFFRIAAILQGIIGRVRDGTATSDHAPAKAAMIRPLAATARSFAREAGAP